MARLITMFLILIAIQAAIMVYSAGDGTPTDLWNFLFNLDKWNTVDFLVTIGAIAAALGLQGVSSGGTFRFITDFIIMAPAIAGLISIAVVFTNLANIVRNDLIAHIFHTCTLDSVLCAPANFIVAILIGPIALYYAWTVLEFWRGRDF